MNLLSNSIPRKDHKNTETSWIVHFQFPSSHQCHIEPLTHIQLSGPSRKNYSPGVNHPQMSGSGSGEAVGHVPRLSRSGKIFQIEINCKGSQNCWKGFEICPFLTPFPRDLPWQEEEGGGCGGEDEPRTGVREKGVPGPGKLAGSRQGAQKGAEARHGAPSLRCGSVFRPSPRVPAPLRSGTATCSTRASGGTRKLYVDSHLDHDSAGCETAFPVSRETELHVGLTLGRGDVMAHASRRRGSYRRHPSPSRGLKRPAEAGKLVAGSEERARFTRQVL